MTTATLTTTNSVTSNGTVLTDDQEAAKTAFLQFMADPYESVFVIEGYSGCGKSTLVEHLIECLPKHNQMMKLIDPSHKQKQMALTATTNKAAENLSLITGQQVLTVYSFCGLKVVTDYKTGETSIMAKNDSVITDHLVFIDEASNLSRKVMQLIFSKLKDCKIVFIGDPAQLVDFKSNDAPVFTSGFKKAQLSETVRQKNTGTVHPITALATMFRHAVETGDFQPFSPDGQHVKHVSNEEFKNMIAAEFSRPNWKYRDSVVLAWTNKRVIQFNNYINNLVKKTPDFVVGDYAIVNSFVANNRGGSFKTDEMVMISKIQPNAQSHGVAGKIFTLNDKHEFFMADSIVEASKRANKARDVGEYSVANEIERCWIDLRFAFASTVDKSQGSTFNTVFIDVADIYRCNNVNRMARMFYVATSRPRHELVLTGDFG